jgi:hypothetical protein
MFVTHPKTPYEVRWTSPAGQEIEVIQIHLAVDVLRAALATAWPGQTDRMEVIDFFGRDEAFSHLCQACAEMLTARTRGHTRRVADLTQLFASYLVEKYTDDAREKSEVRGGLPIRQLHKVEDYVSERLAEEISVETLAGLAELSPFHFSRLQANDRPFPAALSNEAQPDRNRARNRLHQPDCFRASLPPRRRRHADGVPRCFVALRAVQQRSPFEAGRGSAR